MTNWKIEARISNGVGNKVKASVRIEMENGGISISDIFIRESGGKLYFTFPLDRERKPYVYLRGELKQAVNAAIAEVFYQGTGQAAPQTEGA